MANDGIAKRAGRLRFAAALALFALGLVWVRAQPNLPDPSDEVEWTAISIAHVRQLFLGEEPPGAARERSTGGTSQDPWRQGVQGTTFGYPNPGLVKTVLGLLAWARGFGPEQAPAEVFQRFSRGDPEARARAAAAVEPAVPTMAATVAAATSACGALLFWIAAVLAGPLAGLLAWALWLGNPMVAAWSHFVRPDFFMVAFLLATLALALGTLPEAARHPGRAALALGLSAGAAAACKLNGGLAALFVAAAVPLSAALESGPRRWRRAVWILLTSGLVAAALLWALWPYLWRDPSRIRDVLSFWEHHMQVQQDRMESLGGLATRTLGERLRLALHKTLAFDPLPNAGAIADPESYRSRVPWPLSAALLVAALGAFAARLRHPSERLRAALTLTWIAVVAGGTTLWLPLEWDRYYFPYVACAALLEAALVASALAAARARLARAGPRQGRR